MAVERVDYYNDSEYISALHWEEAAEFHYREHMRQWESEEFEKENSQKNQKLNLKE